MRCLALCVPVVALSRRAIAVSQRLKEAIASLPRLRRVGARIFFERKRHMMGSKLVKCTRMCAVRTRHARSSRSPHSWLFAQILCAHMRAPRARLVFVQCHFLSTLHVASRRKEWSAEVAPLGSFTDDRANEPSAFHSAPGFRQFSCTGT
jgi:hypothetical protein